MKSLKKRIRQEYFHVWIVQTLPFYEISGHFQQSWQNSPWKFSSLQHIHVTTTFSGLDEPRGSCRFPDVLINQNLWRDLSGKLQLEVDTGLQVLRLKERNSQTSMWYKESSSSTTKLVLKCVDKTFEAESIGARVSKTEYLAYVTNDSW